MDKSNLFDQKIREAINKYEVPYDDAAWNKIKNEINTPLKPSSTIKLKPWLIGAAAAAMLAVAYFALSPETQESTPELTDSKIELKETIKEQPQSNNTLQEESTETEEVEITDQGEKLEDNKPEEKSIPILINKEEDEADQLIVMEDVIEEIPENIIVENKNEPVDTKEEALLLNVNINQENLCQNEVLVVSLNNANQPVELLWDFGDGITKEGPSAIHKYEEPGTYTLQLNAKSVLNEGSSRKESYTIVVNPAPHSEFEIERGENMYAYPEVSFTMMSELVSSFEWKFSDGSTSNSSVVEKFYNEKGVYTVGLVVSNQFQCTDTLYKQVVIEENFNLLAPNAFSPNGDGINDTFMPQALPYLNQNFTLQIFDPKTSQLVFESSNFEIPWNGNLMNNGNKMKEGAYAWSVRTEDGSVYKGTILITAK